MDPGSSLTFTKVLTTLDRLGAAGEWGGGMPNAPRAGMTRVELVAWDAGCGTVGELGGEKGL